MKNMNSKEMKNKIKKFFNRFWFIVWKDDSPKGWLISILFIFIMIKFVFFPTLNFITGTELPLAIVESCSMYHKGNLFSNTENWFESNKNKYNDFEIDREDFLNFPFKKGFTKGDILFIVGAKPEKLSVGDVIIFEAGTNHPIIHRIVEIKETEDGRVFSTLGDNNPGQLSGEKEIREEQIVGRAVVRVAPYLGWIKLIFYEYKQPINNKGFC